MQTQQNNNSNLITATLHNCRIGRPVLVPNLYVCPILSDINQQPEYISLKQAYKNKLVAIEETETVSTTKIENRSKKPLFIMNGEILEGAKQNRVINDSILIPSQTKKRVDVSCVEEGRWSNNYESFKQSDDLFNYTSKNEKSKSVFESKLRSGSRKADQSGVWDEIRKKQSRMGVRSQTYSAKDTYTQFDEKLRRYERVIKTTSNQVGVVFYLKNQCVGMDLFDSSVTYQEFSKKILRSIAIDAIEEDKRTSFSGFGPENNLGKKLIDQFFDLMVSLKEKTIPAPYMGTEVVLNYPALNYYGSGIANNGRIIHLNCFHHVEFATSQYSTH